MPIHPYHGARPEIHPNTWIAPNAEVIGDVSLDEGVSIWFGAMLRGDVCAISIGPFSSIQDRVVIHEESAQGGRPCTPAIVGDHVTVGPSCIVHGCRVGGGAFLGAGSVVMNGAEVCENAALLPMSLVTEAKRMPARTLAGGAPATVVRELAEADLSAQHRLAELYWELALGHREAGIVLPTRRGVS